MAVSRAKSRPFRPTIKDLITFYARGNSGRLVRKLRPGFSRLPTGVRYFRIREAGDCLRHLDSFDSVSLDVFDTLLYRVHGDPELIKPRVCYFVSLLMSSEAIEHEPWRLIHLRRQIEWHLCERRHCEGLDPECTLDEIAAGVFDTYGVKNSEPLVRKWLDYEFYAENTWIEAPPPVRGLLDAIEQSGKRLFYLSDMYMNEELVDAMLTEKGIRHYAEALYVSGTRKLGKYSGKLFQLLQDAHGVKLDKHIHIGDSLRSDVRGPANAGASSAWLMDWKPDERVKGDFASVHRTWAAERGELNPRLDNCGYRIGHHLLGPAFLAYTVHVLDQAIRERASAILFLAREGELFKWAAEQLWDTSPKYRFFEKPRFEYAQLSRAAVAPAAQSGIGHAELVLAENRLWPLCVRHVCETFGLDEETVQPLARKYYISMHEELDKWDPRLEGLLADPEFERYCQKNAEHHRKLLLKYLDTIGVKKGAGPVVLCDMGWSGTIQHLLDRALSAEKRMPKRIGIYFGMHWNDIYSFDGESSTIQPGFALDSRREHDLAYEYLPLKPLFEVAATATHGSAKGFELDSHGVIHVRLGEPSESFDDGRAEIQAGTRDFIEHFMSVYALYEWPPETMRDHVLAIMGESLLDPSLNVARTVGNLTQSVDWGSSHRVTVVPQGVSPLDWLRPRKFRRNMHAAIWKNGVIRQMGLTPRQFDRIARLTRPLRRLLRR